MSMLEMLTQQLGGGTMKQISGLVGGDEAKTQAATSGALTTLLGALSRNANRGDGAQALSSALAKDHDGSVLNNLQQHLQSADQGPGDGILKHVLGNRRQVVEAGLSKSTGMDQGSVGKLLKMLAPVVMGALGKAQRQDNMNPQALAGFLGQQTKEIDKQQPGASGILGRLLDADGDGDVDMGDLLKGGGGLLGKFLGR